MVRIAISQAAFDAIVATMHGRNCQMIHESAPWISVRKAG